MAPHGARQRYRDVALLAEKLDFFVVCLSRDVAYPVADFPACPRYVAARQGLLQLIDGAHGALRQIRQQLFNIRLREHHYPFRLEPLQLTFSRRQLGSQCRR
jgi:hypothetical protein